MSLLNLAGQVCCAFNESQNQRMRTVQKVKDNEPRDVVTELDLKLHSISERFVEERLPLCEFLSEEGGHEKFQVSRLAKAEWLIFDPLDGSSNYAAGLPNYGYMAAHVRLGKVVGSVIVIPEHSQYIVLENDALIYSQPLPLGHEYDKCSVYYAYPPKQDSVARKARDKLQDLIDHKSAGLYRYGSACAGLYQLLCDKHMAFIGHGIRLWDAVAFLPVLVSEGIAINYHIQGMTISLVASKDVGFVMSASEIVQQEQGVIFNEYMCGEVLRCE